MTSATAFPPRGRQPKPSLLAAIFAPVPGLGHWLIRRGGRGFAAFAIFTFGLNLLVLSRVLPTLRNENEITGSALAGIAVLYSLVDVWHLGVFRRRAAHRAGISALLDEGLARFDKGDVRGARSSFEHAAEADPDDPTPRLHLAWLERHAGRHVEALTHARAGLRLAREDAIIDALTAEVDAARAALHKT